MRTGIHAVHPLLLAVLITAVTLVGGILSPRAAIAATYYVATNGDDANSGTQSQPFRSIARGLSALKAGDTLYIRSGTYAESIDSNAQTIPAGTSWSNPVTIAAYPGETMTLRPPGGSVINIAASYVQYVIFDGLIMDGTNTNFPIGGNGGHHVRFQNGEVKNGRASGILTGGNNNEFINLKIHTNGSSKLDHGLYIFGSNNLIERNEIYNNAGYGVHLYYGGGGVNNNIVRSNISHNNGTAGDVSSAGILLASGDGNLAYNNILYGNPYGIQVSYSASNTKVYNNTVSANTYLGVDIYTSSSGAIIKNNILYQNGGAISDLGSGTVRSNNLTTNPLFVDAAAHNFALQAGSPAMDAGGTISEVTDDYDGVSRPQGAAYDIGAYEYRATVTTTAPAAPTNLRIVQ